MNTELDVEKTISELERVASDVLNHKKSSIPRRPIVIEFCGSPKSGKTGCINALDLFLRRNMFRTRICTERASVCPVVNKFDPFFNIWTVSSIVAELSEVLANHPKDYDVVILDRGIFDALCWFTWLLEQNCLANEDYERLTNYLTMMKWRKVIDLVYIFQAKPSVSMDREYAYLLTRKVGSIMRHEVLESYNSAVSKTKERFGNMFRKVVNFDTSDMGLNKVSYNVTKDILNITQEITSEVIGYFDRSLLNDVSDTCFFYEDALKDRLKKLEFGIREQVESNADFVQPVPILVMTDDNKEKLLVAKKNKRVVSNNSPEQDKLLVYFGGHVRNEDSTCLDDGDVLSIIRTALNREVKEEIGVDFCTTENNPLCIWVKSNERSIKHLAICFVYQRNLGFMKYKFDQNEFSTRGRGKSGQIIAADDLTPDYNELEDWGKLILKQVFKKEPTQTSFLKDDQ